MSVRSAVELVLVAVLVTAGAVWWYTRPPVTDAARAAEVPKLQEAGGTVAKQLTQADLDRAVSEAVREAVRRVQRAAPSKITETRHEETGTVPAVGATPTDRPACLLAPGDTGRIVSDSVRLETKAGNQVVVGHLACWRTTPGPEAEIMAGDLDVSLSSLGILPPVKPLRFYAEGGIGAGLHGMTYALGGGVRLSRRVSVGGEVVATASDAAVLGKVRFEW